ncbi:hypothetical protein D5086_033783 [Populus alba]|uniref:Uncharacterized protein n=1 Tax=Populus alba TaxID=43335 RepID=A0ACC4AHS9_POPAL
MRGGEVSGSAGKKNGDDCGKRNDDGEESLEVLYGFGPRRGEGRRVLSFVGNEGERLGRVNSAANVTVAINAATTR